MAKQEMKVHLLCFFAIVTMCRADWNNNQPFVYSRYLPDSSPYQSANIGRQGNTDNSYLLQNNNENFAKEGNFNYLNNDKDGNLEQEFIDTATPLPPSVARHGNFKRHYSDNVNLSPNNFVARQGPITENYQRVSDSEIIPGTEDRFFFPSAGIGGGIGGGISGGISAGLTGGIGAGAGIGAGMGAGAGIGGHLGGHIGGHLGGHLGGGVGGYAYPYVG